MMMTEENENGSIIEEAKKDIALSDRNAQMLATSYDLSAKQLVELQRVDVDKQEEAAKSMQQANTDSEKSKKSTGSFIAKDKNQREQKAIKGVRSHWGTSSSSGWWD